MSHTPHPPPVANPLVLVLTGDRLEAVAWEDALQRYCNAGLRRLANAPGTDPAAALETLADCAPGAFTRYNGENNLTPIPGTPLDEV
jgi:hypothetical protein